MAEKKRLRDYLVDDESEESGGNKPRLSDYLGYDVGAAVGDNISTRVNNWIYKHNNYIGNYQKRYSSRKYTYEDAYVSDSGSWLETARKQADELEAERQNILTYMDQYKAYIDPKWAKSVQDALAGESNKHKSIIENATMDNDYWLKFTPNKEQTAAGYTAEKLYNEWQKSEQQRAEDLAYNVRAGEQEIALLKKGRESYLAQKEAKRQEALENETWWEKLGRWSGNNYDTSIPLAGASQYVGADGYTTPYDERIADLEARVNRARYVQTSEGWKKKYDGMSLDDINIALNNLEDGEEKDWLEDNKWSRAFAESDFEQYAANGAAIKNPTYEEAEGSKVLWWGEDPVPVGNVVTYSRDNASMLAVAKGNNGETKSGDYRYRSLYEDEVKLYNYLLAKYGADEAQKFLDYMSDELNKREGGELAKRLREIDIPVVEQLAIGGFGLASGMEQWASGTRQFFTDEVLPTTVTQYANDALAQSATGIGKYAYQATNVIGNMLPSIMLTKGLGALGAGFKAAKVAGVTAMSIGAAGNAYSDGIERYGMEPWEARIYGTLVGASEGALEYAIGGIPALRGTDDIVSAKIKTIDRSLLRVGAKLGWNTLGEIGEEELQNYLEPLFRSFFTGEYDAPTFDELLETAIVTLISTPVMSGGEAINDIHSARKAYKQYGGKTDALIQEGLESDVNSESYKLAQQFQQQVQGQDGQDGKPLSGNQIRNLLEANQEQITPKDLKKIQQAAEKRLTALGQTENVSRVAELATKRATGKRLTRSERSELANSQYGARVANELLPKNILSGGYSSEWAEDIGTKKINSLAYNKKTLVRELVEAMSEDPTAYKSLESRMDEDKTAKVSSTGKAVIRATNEEIDLSNPKIKTITKDSVVLDVDGKDVDISKINFENEDQWNMFNALKKIEHITPAAASSMIAKLDMSKPIWGQLNGMDEAFTYGYYNYSEADLKAGLFTGNLTKDQLNDAFKLGQYVAEKSQTDKAERFKAMRTAAQAEAEKAEADGKGKPQPKNLAVSYNQGNGKVVSIEEAGITDAKRSSAVDVAKILHGMGLGTKIEFFTSKESDTLTVTDKNGKTKKARVFINDAGVEQIAYSGVYRKSDGTIRVDLNAYNGKGLTLNVLAHELTHFIQQWSDRKYKVLVDFLMKTYESTDLTMHERVLREQKRLEEIRGEEVSYDEAYDEVVANAMSKMFDDGNMVEKLAKLKEQDKNLAQKLWEGFKEILAKFIGIYEKEGALFQDADDLMQMKDTFEQLQNMFAEALVEASENYQASLITKEAGLEFVAVEDVSQYSYSSLAEAAGFVAVENDDGTRAFTRDGKKVSKVTVEDIDNSPIGAFINFSLEMGDISDADALRQKEMFAKICTMACKTNDFAMTMQFVGSAVFTGMKANADKQYGTTYDFPSICTKTQAVIDAMSAKMMSLGRGLNADEIVQLYADVFASGNPVPCPECYVFSRWIGIGGLLDNIKKYQDYYGNMAVEDVAAEYRKMKAEVSKFAEEQGISFGKAKGALTSKLTKEFNKLTEKIEKNENQGEKVKQSDRDRLAELEPMMNTVKGMTWLENVYFADSSLKKVNPKFRVPNEVLFDLNNGEAFASQYKEAWAFRTTQGAGYGKAITPYAEARLGEGVLVTNNTTNAIKGKAQGSLNNYFLNQKGKLDKQSRDALKRARLKQKIQAFLGGQRFQSTSDARYENASDYLLAALEMQAMGGMVQCYTKVDGAVPAFSAWGFSINQSLMPLNGGLDENGNVKDTPVGGMKPSVAFENRKNHETAGTITIGVNDRHIREMFKQWVRDFIIPYHASGGKADVVAEFRRIQEGKEAKGKAVRSTDYSRTQGDKVLSDEVLRWQGKTDAQIQRIHEIRNARIAILTGGKPNMTVVRSNRFLSALYDKFKGGEWDGVKVAKSKVESQIFPNEFWDQTVTYEESGKITKDYLEYCNDLGFLHRFSGTVPSNGRLVPVNGYNENGERVQLTDLAYKYDENGNKTTEVEEFFWKVLTDRRMYDNNGNYLAQKVVTLNDTTADTVTGFAKNNQGREYDKAKAEALAQKILKGEQYSSQETDLDSEGNQLSAEQQAFFKDSKVRNADGRLMVLYHGTPNGSTTIFDKSKTSKINDMGQGIYFSTNKGDASSYMGKSRNKKLYSTYVNIKAPFVVSDNVRITVVEAASLLKLCDDRMMASDVYREIKINAKDGYITTAQLANTNISQNMTEILEKSGKYDGIIDETVSVKFGLEEGTKHIIALNSNQIKLIDNQKPTTNPDIRYSSQETDADKKITLAMTDSERTEILQTKAITAEVYDGKADAIIDQEKNWLESGQLGLVESALAKIADEFHVFTGYDIKDVGVKIEFSRSNLSETVSKKITPKAIAKLLPVLKTAVENAVGIESHVNRYFYDTDIVRFDNLVGGYVDGESFVPVRFGLKHRRNGEAVLYVILDQHKIPLNKIKAEVVEIADTQNVRPEVSRSAFKASIADIIPFVNGGDLLRYVPDDMLTESQKQIKWDAIADTIVKTNKKNDAKYAKYIREGKIRVAEQMVARAAKDAGYTTSGFHGSRTPGFTVVDKYSWLWLARDKSVASGYGTHNTVNSKGKPHDEYGVYAMLYNLGNNLKVYADGASWGELPVTADEYPGVYADEETGYITTNAMAEWAERNGYDSITFVDVDDGGLTTVDVVFNPNRDAKSADPITYDDDGNVIPISQRFDQEKDDIRYSEHDTDYSNRSLLANAFEGITKSSDEYKLVQEYKGRIRILNEQEEKLAKLNAEIRKVRFTKGEYDAKKLKELEAEAKNVAESINRQDRKLLSLEASGPLRKLIEQERKKEALKTIDHVKEIVQNKKDRAEQTELRHKIRKAVRDLDKILNRGNKKRNVKQDMKGFVSKALELADYLFTDHISNDELIRKGITVRMTPREAALVKETEDILSQLYDNADNLTDEEFTRMDEKRKANEDKLRDLLTAQRNERLSTPVYNLFNDLVTEYANLKNSKQEAVKAAYDPNVERFLRSYIGESDGETDSDRKTLLQNMRVADMTTDELWKLHNAYKMVLHSVRNANALWVKGKTETIEQMAGRIMGDFSKRKIPDKKVATVIRNLSNKIGWDYEKLYYALDRIGSEAFTELVMNIANSENIVMQDVIEAAAFRDEMVKEYGFNNWDVNKEIDKEFLDNTGKKFKMTLGQLMSLYAYSRRSGAWDHIEYGGFVFGEAALTNPRPADSYKLSKAQCEALISLLTDKQKAYVEAMQKFLSETMGAKGNEVSMQLYGIEMFGEKNYFPIHIAGQYKAQAQESQAKAAAGFGTMSNAGFTHAQNPNAKAPFVMEGFNEIWADHVNEMSRYHGTVPALEDMRRVMNRSFYSESGMESMAIKQLMENSFGKEAVEYFDNLYREANSGAITDKLQKKSHKLLNLFRKNSVAYSLSVLIQQPASVVRAYAMIDRKYFGVKGVGTITSGVVKAVSDKWTKAHTNAYNEMLKYAPGVTMAKEIGGFDTHTGGSIRRYLLDTSKSLKQKWKTGTVAEKGKAVLDLVDDNAIANLPNLADKIAWIEIWNACKRETVAKHKDLATNSDEFLQIVGDRFTEVIRATQVYDSIFAKSPMLKSKNLAVQYLVSFMNEPNTVANMVEKAVRDVTNGDWKVGLKTAHVVIHSIIFTSLLKSIIYAMRDDDEDETYTEKYIEALTGSLMDDFNPLNYIPLARDVWSLAQGYDVERADMAIVADALDALNRVIQNATTNTDDMTEEQLAEFEKKVTEANWKLVESMASFFGIPVKNVRREVEGVLDHARIASANTGKTTPLSAWNKIRESVIESIPFMSAKVSKQDKLYEAIVAGDTVYVDRLKSGYKDEDAYNTAVRKALRENDPRIRAAAQAYYDGNIEEYKRIFMEIRNEDKHNLIGFDNIMEAVMSEVSSIKGENEPKTESSAYSATDFVNAVLVGDTDLAETMKEDIISYKVANGATREEAEEAFTSSVSTSTRNAFDSGLLGEAEAEKMLMEYTDMDEEEAASKVDYWSFIKAHPQYRGVLSQSNVEKYHEFAEPAEIPLDVFVQYINSTKGIETKYDKWGDVELTVREQVLDAIDSLPISWQQKDALYLAHGYAESKIWDVPW